MEMKDLVRDWGGFEELVADLHRTGNVTVQRDVTLTGQSGAPRQIDVLITHREGLYDHKILVECKHWNRPIERLHIDAMATAIRDLGASKGVFFTTKGFQSGALHMAQSNSVDLYRVREPTEDEWGAPGRVVDLYFQFVCKAVSNFQFEYVTSTPAPVIRLTTSI